ASRRSPRDGAELRTNATRLPPSSGPASPAGPDAPAVISPPARGTSGRPGRPARLLLLELPDEPVELVGGEAELLDDAERVADAHEPGDLPPVVDAGEDGAGNVQLLPRRRQRLAEDLEIAGESGVGADECGQFRPLGHRHAALDADRLVSVESVREELA